MQSKDWNEVEMELSRPASVSVMKIVELMVEISAMIVAAMIIVDWIAHGGCVTRRKNDGK